MDQISDDAETSMWRVEGLRSNTPILLARFRRSACVIMCNMTHLERSVIYEFESMALIRAMRDVDGRWRWLSANGLAKSMTGLVCGGTRIRCVERRMAPTLEGRRLARHEESSCESQRRIALVVPVGRC
jgi:hypothetical protein